MPKLAHDMGLDLDKVRTTVCAIHGTHFASYVRYLSALGTPWAVVTDGDPRKGTGSSETSEDDVSDSGEGPAEEVDGSSEELAGTVRAERLVAVLGLEGPPEQHGIFVGDVTLEPDLLATSTRNRETCVAVLADNDWAAPTASQIENWRQGGAIDHEAFMRVLKRFGKARFAQRLAAQDTELDSPGHIVSALEFLLP